MPENAVCQHLFLRGKHLCLDYFNYFCGGFPHTGATDANEE